MKEPKMKLILTAPIAAQPQFFSLKAIGETLALWRTRAAERKELRDTLLHEPASVLEDAGWERTALKAEIAKRFWEA